MSLEKWIAKHIREFRNIGSGVKGMAERASPTAKELFYGSEKALTGSEKKALGTGAALLG